MLRIRSLIFAHNYTHIFFVRIYIFYERVHIKIKLHVYIMKLIATYRKAAEKLINNLNTVKASNRL